MFILKIIRWFFGSVSFRAEGGFPERLLNLCSLNNIELWSVRREAEYLYAKCKVKDYKKLRAFRKKAGMRIKATDRFGAPFILKKHEARAGVLIGLVVFMFVIQTLSQKTWIVAVNGNENVSTEKILATFEGLGVVIGEDLSHLDINTIQLDAQILLPEISWCTVNLSGSVATIEVTERVLAPDILSSSQPADIISQYDAHILSIDVIQGTAKVQSGDAVTKDTLLAEGVDPQTGEKVHAKAVIRAEVQLNYEIIVPYAEEVLKPSEKPIIQTEFQLFNFTIPLYTNGKISDEYSESDHDYMLFFSGKKLPVGFSNKKYNKMVTTFVQRSKAGGENDCTQQT